jgi:hypothetical protein
VENWLIVVDSLVESRIGASVILYFDWHYIGVGTNGLVHILDTSEIKPNKILTIK